MSEPNPISTSAAANNAPSAPPSRPTAERSRPGRPAQLPPRHWPGAEQEKLLLSRAAIASIPATVRQDQLRRLRDLKRAIGGYYDAGQEKFVPGYTCSAAWFDAVWQRGEHYAPNAPCACESCQGRRRFPAYYRGHSPLPRVNGKRSERTAPISYECYLENREIDAELAQDLRPLQGASASVIATLPTKFRGKARHEIL